MFVIALKVEQKVEKPELMSQETVQECFDSCHQDDKC